VIIAKIERNKFQLAFYGFVVLAIGAAPLEKPLKILVAPVWDGTREPKAIK
jgi:hypothetical protein